MNPQLIAQANPFDPLTVILLSAGGLFSVISGIGYIVAGFRQGIGWGIGNLLIPGCTLLFTVLRWHEARIPFFLSLLGIGFFGGGVYRIAPHIDPAILQNGFADIASVAAGTDAAPPSIDALREEVFALQEKVRADATVVHAAYRELNDRRGNLQQADAAALAAFNARAAEYKAANERLASEQKMLAEKQELLSDLLSRRETSEKRPPK